MQENTIPIDFPQQLSTESTCPYCHHTDFHHLTPATGTIHWGRLTCSDCSRQIRWVRDPKKTEKEREQDRKEAISRHMEGKPPTEKQLWFIKQAGIANTPKDRAEASKWIDAIKRRQS